LPFWVSRMVVKWLISRRLSHFGWRYFRANADLPCVFRAKSATDSEMKSATDSDLISAIPN
jgi:hypothetical protein